MSVTCNKRFATITNEEFESKEAKEISFIEAKRDILLVSNFLSLIFFEKRQ